MHASAQSNLDGDASKRCPSGLSLAAISNIHLKLLVIKEKCQDHTSSPAESTGHVHKVSKMETRKGNEKGSRLDDEKGFQMGTEEGTVQETEKRKLHKAMIGW